MASLPVMAADLGVTPYMRPPAAGSDSTPILNFWAGTIINPDWRGGYLGIVVPARGTNLWTDGVLFRGDFVAGSDNGRFQNSRGSYNSGDVLIGYRKAIGESFLTLWVGPQFE